jgi:hypothetical protein
MDNNLIEVCAPGDPVAVYCVVGPTPLKQITDRPVKVYRRSGFVRRLLKSGQLRAVAKAAPPAGPADAKSKPKGGQKGD